MSLLVRALETVGEGAAHINIGNFGSKAGVSYSYPSAGGAHPHAPNYVGGNQYLYDANGNLTSVESRTYEYDIENHLTRVLEGGTPRRALTYDGDGVLRSSTDESNRKALYVTPDYQVDLATGKVSVYYRFAGRGVAWRNSLGLRYILADHLSSSQAEVGEDQAEMGQRRFYPFGSDREIPWAGDLSTDERFTSQRRIDAGGGNARRELYYYGARWYLPGVGIFTQPDFIVPDYKNPQALNRYSYGYNNPVKYLDPTGHDPLDSDWEKEFQTFHGRLPNDDDRIDRLASYYSSAILGKGWTNDDWARYGQMKQAGIIDPTSVLQGASGVVPDQIKIASALITLASSGSAGLQIYSSFIKRGGRVQFGGGRFIKLPNGWVIGRQDGYSIGWDNVVYLEPSLRNESAEIIAANIAHEAYHAQQSTLRWPFSRSEEVRAFAQEARAWEGLRVTYKGSGGYGDILDAYTRGQLDRYVGRGIYNSWFYVP